MRSTHVCALAFILFLSLRCAIAATVATCDWHNPGHDPFMGDVPAAVDHYRDIPAATRARLKDRMRRFDYDDVVAIRKHSIAGRSAYEPAIRAMHFGTGRICAEVTRDRWSAGHEERALVYCEDGFCILVPSVCRNVSRIERRAVTAPVASAPPAAAAPEAPASPPMSMVLLDAPATATDMPPPAAGWRPWSPVWHAPPPWLIGGDFPGGSLPPTGPSGPMPNPPPSVTPPTWPAVTPPLPSTPPDIAPPTGPELPPVASVPEPPIWSLFGAGLLLVMATRRRPASTG
ncbi:MHFG family PEP-CTERM protein [Xylophilus sp. GOD-11R]|uniref:MHFG family PEP-CTERM protein n=1 Tax=Xylophilus sp. GOD-11R TaxID=3089814 RepID=UPI00298CFE5C|nr:MHFG family PEP-CTERM protein [Xylophilus sp. GOD-11R]WPB57104.1 MHFG family PEP-CTERM protein [Xylophilus sp. GOD-11R]